MRVASSILDTSLVVKSIVFPESMDTQESSAHCPIRGVLSITKGRGSRGCQLTPIHDPVVSDW